MGLVSLDLGYSLGLDPISRRSEEPRLQIVCRRIQARRRVCLDEIVS
jgi:hypothetical protein